MLNQQPDSDRTVCRVSTQNALRMLACEMGCTKSSNKHAGFPAVIVVILFNQDTAIENAQSLWLKVWAG